MKYKAAVIGCGMIGCGYDDDPKRKQISSHAGAYRNNPRIELVGLADVDAEKLSTYSKKFAVPGYTNYLEMLEKEKPEIVSVCTNTATHAKIVLEIAQEAAKSGSSIKAIFCEKPLAATSEEAQAMLQACTEKNIFLLVNHSRRFDLTHRETKTFLEAGGLGEIQQVSAYYVKGLANSGSHLLDMLRFFLGEVEWVQATSSKNPSSLENDANVDGFIHFKSGVCCTLQSLEVKSYWLFEIRIYGTKGLLEIKDSGFTFKYYSPQDSPRFSGFKELQEEKLPFPEHPKEMLPKAVENLINTIENKEKLWCPGEEGVAVLKLIEALRTSAREEGKKIYL